MRRTIIIVTAAVAALLLPTSLTLPIKQRGILSQDIKREDLIQTSVQAEETAIVLERTDVGLPIADDLHSETVGADGPIVLQDF